jgi:hypothetical protein
MRRQVRPKSMDWVNSDSCAYGAPEWTHRILDREQWKQLLRQASTVNWLQCQISKNPVSDNWCELIANLFSNIFSIVNKMEIQQWQRYRA